ncbi:MAG: cation transporter [Desulfobacterium sp.]|nr:cation transporter [Desulfobacterium sp.]MBU3949687.1 cation diffusion facilitator family transporter [Pseudomonadota bacterium]MBU4035415.1 cation diffusion facilitator family transporter [Pseudomonadota bacterium]
MARSSITKYAWLSILAAISTIALKSSAYFITGSVGLLSDAAESLVNLLGAGIALAMLTIAARPPDEEHLFGHDKAEYFACGAEGALIVIAAVSIVIMAIKRFINPVPIQQLGIGLIISAVASLINFVVSRILLRAGKKNHSVTLEADAHHLMTDVWTSIGVFCGISAVALTGWQPLDQIVALCIASYITWIGFKLIMRSVLGLMDSALPHDKCNGVITVLEKYKSRGIDYHALRTRQAGSRCFVSVHILVPGTWTVQHGHELLEELEADIRSEVMYVTVFTHLEPLEDPVSEYDIELDRCK